MIARLERKKLRDAFPERDFSNWIRDNLDQINELTSLSLSLAEREQPAGGFRADLIATDSDERIIVIENQLGVSDHDHLGKLLTYLAAYEAKAAIWIIEEARPEHVEAVAWLNQSSPAEFYMLKAEAVRTGNCDFAPLLTVIVSPSDEGKEIAEEKGRIAQRFSERHAFWKGLLEFAKEKTPLHSECSPTSKEWLGTASGKRGISFVYVVRKHDVWVELSIECGQENEAIFKSLFDKKEDVQKSFGLPQLEWKLKKRDGRIRAVSELGGFADPEKKIDLYGWMTDRMIALEKAFRPHIDALKL